MAATKQLQPFLRGTRGVWRKIAQIPVNIGLAAPTTKISKNGFLGILRHRITGTVTVNGAGAAGVPNLQNLISSMVLSLSGNYQYRNIDGERMWLWDNLQNVGYADSVAGSPSYQNYNPTSATQQSVSLPLRDCIALNSQYNLDTFLLAAQARNYDITLDVTYGTLAQIVAGNETINATALTHYIEGYYMLDADYTQFAPPDLSTVQQLLKDDAFTNVVVGDNIVPIVPINGPQLLGLGFAAVFNGVRDVQGVSSKLTNMRLRVNNAQDLIDIPIQDFDDENFDLYGRSLPFGYRYINLLDDVSINNAVSPYWTKALATATLSSLELILTVAAGTVVTGTTGIKLFKRYRNPAITGGS